MVHNQLGKQVSWLHCTEPIQSRCAVLRYSKLSDAEILGRVQEICDKEKVMCFILSTEIWIDVLQVPCSDDGMEAIVFTAQGDMRQVRVPSWLFILLQWCLGLCGGHG